MSFEVKIFIIGVFPSLVMAFFLFKKIIVLKRVLSDNEKMEKELYE